MLDWKVNMAWHDDEKTRKALGDKAEKAFSEKFRCYDGGQFVFIGNQYPGCPDFTCDTCGRLVEVKISPQMEQTGNIAVSAIPWDEYPDNLLLVTFVDERLLGEYKEFISLQERTARKPTHNGTGKFKNTKFYLISWKQFRESGELGLITK
jgi:hypothetical protein